jgi:hypothetical protein
MSKLCDGITQYYLKGNLLRDDFIYFHFNKQCKFHLWKSAAPEVSLSATVPPFFRVSKPTKGNFLPEGRPQTWGNTTDLREDHRLEGAGPLTLWGTCLEERPIPLYMSPSNLPCIASFQGELLVNYRFGGFSKKCQSLFALGTFRQLESLKTWCRAACDWQRQLARHHLQLLPALANAHSGGIIGTFLF